MNENIIVACDGENDGKDFLTQYLVGNPPPNNVDPLWEVIDEDGPDNGCAAHTFTSDKGYYAIKVRGCVPPIGEGEHCTRWNYTDGIGGS